MYRRLLDGASIWGAITVCTNSGVTSYRLVVYPPGICAAQRRHLRLWRAFPLWGALLWTAGQLMLGQLRGSLPAQTLLAVTVLGLGEAARHTAGSLRAAVRTAAVSVSRAPWDPHNELRRSAALLLAADQRLRDGDIDPVAHEVVWWQVYQHMDAAGIRTVTPGT